MKSARPNSIRLLLLSVISSIVLSALTLITLYWIASSRREPDVGVAGPQGSIDNTLPQGELITQSPSTTPQSAASETPEELQREFEIWKTSTENRLWKNLANVRTNSPAGALDPRVFSYREAEDLLNNVLQRFKSQTTNFASDTLIAHNSSVNGDELSWRVHLLPAFGLDELYNKFHLDEPWDSTHNKQFIDDVPAPYRTSRSAIGKTRLKSPLNLDGPIKRQTRFEDVVDGFQHTCIFKIVKEEHQVVWTRPDHNHQFANDPADELQPTDAIYHQFMITGSGKPILPYAILTEKIITSLTNTEGREFLFDAEAASKEYINRLEQTGTVKEKPLRPKLVLIDQPKYKDVEIQISADWGLRIKNLDYGPQSKMRKIARIAMALDAAREAIQKDPTHEWSGLSWRVHLLPYLEEKTLYEKFKLNEPWDSPANRELLKSIPAVYSLDSPTGRTCIQALDEFIIRDFVEGRINDPVGTSCLLYITALHEAVPWTAPDQRTLPNSMSLHSLLGINKSSWVVALNDNSFFVGIPFKLHAAKIEALTNPKDNLDFDLIEALKNPEEPLETRDGKIIPAKNEANK